MSGAAGIFAVLVHWAGRVVVPFSLGFSINHLGLCALPLRGLSPSPRLPSSRVGDSNLPGTIVPFYPVGWAWHTDTPAVRPSHQGENSRGAEWSHSLSRATHAGWGAGREVTPGASSTASPQLSRCPRPRICTVGKACTDAPGPRGTHRSQWSSPSTQAGASKDPGRLRAPPTERSSGRSRSEAGPVGERAGTSWGRRGAGPGRGRSLGTSSLQKLQAMAEACGLVGVRPLFGTFRSWQTGGV